MSQIMRFSQVLTIRW